MACFSNETKFRAKKIVAGISAVIFLIAVIMIAYAVASFKSADLKKGDSKIPFPDGGKVL